MLIDLNKLPSYDQLPVKEGAPRGSAWGLFGDDDQIGTVNLMTAQKAIEAARLVKKGALFPLNLPIDVPHEEIYARKPPIHHIEEHAGISREDWLDSFYPQASSQWDGLRHIRHPRDGFYNGVKEEEVTLEPGSKLGIEHWAQRGMVARGVLLDLERFRRQSGQPIDCRSSEVIRKDILEACARAQGVEVRPGDVLILRFGWIKWYLEESSPEEREGLNTDYVGTGLTFPGIGPSEEMAEYLWDLHIAAVAADNPAVNHWPPTPETGFLHFKLIPHFGMPMGELWYLEELAADCAQDRVYEFMLTSAPLNVPGGVGSPPNALAIK